MIEHVPPLFEEKALSSCKPILCFDKRCKLEKYYQKYYICNDLVADYFDIESIYEKAINPTRNKLVDKDYFSILLEEFFERKINLNIYNKPYSKSKKPIIKIITRITNSSFSTY